MARTRYRIVDNVAPYFLTATTVNWIPLFGSQPIKQILLDSLNFLQQEGRWTLYAYVIMENHVHLVARAADLSKEVGDFKSFTARSIVDFLKLHDAKHILAQLAFHKKRYKTDRDYQVWQEGSHPQRVQGLEMMRQKVQYIHENPVKRGWIDESTHWRYSSARNYAGQEGLIPVTTKW